MNLKTLSDLDSIEVNRNVFVNYENDLIVKRELHSISDASLRAYRATIKILKLLWNQGKFIPISLQPNTYCPTKINHYTTFRIVRKLDFSPLDKFCQNCYRKGCPN